jgi:hypothetical protein
VKVLELGSGNNFILNMYFVRKKRILTSFYSGLTLSVMKQTCARHKDEPSLALFSLVAGVIVEIRVAVTARVV